MSANMWFSLNGGHSGEHPDKVVSRERIECYNVVTFSRLKSIKNGKWLVLINTLHPCGDMILSN